MQPIRLQYELTARDLQQATLAVTKAAFSKGLFFFGMLLAGSAFAVAYALYVGESPPLGPTFFCAAGLGVPVLALWSGDRTFRRMPDWQRAIALEFSPLGIKIADSRQHVSLDWDSFERWEVTLGTLILVQKTGLRQAFVLRGLDASKRQHLEDLLKQCIAPSKSRSRFSRTFVLWCILVLLFVAVYNLISE